MRKIIITSALCFFTLGAFANQTNNTSTSPKFKANTANYMAKRQQNVKQFYIDKSRNVKATKFSGSSRKSFKKVSLSKCKGIKYVNKLQNSRVVIKTKRGNTCYQIVR